ncbi:polysaccharide pyruvyl transferase family protein [Laceyella putida]|uniref:Polysaccharide pyruvyl transferase family protein n=1 Tax=Laceyella putida TaxID=110101 RepID=A0ABW2RKS5_9BACL
MKICVCGYFGMGNFGDELFLKTYQQVFSNHHVFSWEPFLDTKQIDAVIIGGGDLITPYWFNQHYFPSDLENHPTWIYSVGIADFYPLETWPDQEVQKYRERTQKAVRFAVRDENSAKLARNIGLHHQVDIVPDAAFSYKVNPIPIEKFSIKPIIGICIHSYEHFPYGMVRDVLAGCGQKGYDFLFIPVIDRAVNPYADVPACRKLMGMVREKCPDANVHILEIAYLDQICNWLKAIDYLISFKLHPSLIAVREGTPVLCINSHSKVKSLMSKFGLDDFVIKENVSKEQLENKLSSFLQTGKERLQKAVPLVNRAVQASGASLERLKKDIEDYFK